MAPTPKRNSEEQLIADNAQLIVDTRNAMVGVKGSRRRIVQA
jgi:hypothetical protein